MPVRPFVQVTILALLACAAALATPAAAQYRALDALPGLAPADHHVVTSKHTGREHQIFIRLPERYDEEPGKHWPVVFLLDGDILFPMLGSYHLLLHYDLPVPDAIVVGIGYGSFGEGNYRYQDYSTPPLPEDIAAAMPEEYGYGADTYLKFIEEEVFAHVKMGYRADPERRILVGQSRGAHFVLYAARQRPELFWGMIASNPSLRPNTESFYADYAAIPEAGTKLYFSSGENDLERLRGEALDLFAHLEAQESLPWRLKMATVPGGTHSASIVDVYRDAMLWLFEDEADDWKSVYD